MGILSKNKIIKFIYNKRELGRNIKQLYNERIINDDLYDRLNDLRSLLNYGKHVTGSNRENTFDSEYAIVFYFETRIIGNELFNATRGKGAFNRFSEITDDRYKFQDNEYKKIAEKWCNDNKIEYEKVC